VSTFCNPFRSTADMVADGTVSRPAYLDVDGPFAAVAGATAATLPVAPVKRSQARAASELPSVAAAADKQAAAEQKKRRRPADRIGRLLH
jgi:hypothetical protein